MGFLMYTVTENQDFCVADFATLPDERRSRSKLFKRLIWIKEPCVPKSEGLTRSKILGILHLTYQIRHI